jgi:hypothetical protein
MKTIAYTPEELSVPAPGAPAALVAETWTTPFVLLEFALKTPFWLQQGKSRIALSIYSAIEASDTECTVSDEEHEAILTSLRICNLQMMNWRFARYFLRVLDAVESATTPKPTTPGA